MGAEDYDPEILGYSPKFAALIRAARLDQGCFSKRLLNSGSMGITISPDNRTIAGGRSNGIELFDINTSERSRGFLLSEKDTAEVHSEGNHLRDVIYNIAFTPDSRFVAAGDRKGNVYLWDLATRALRWLKDGAKKGGSFEGGGEGHGFDAVVAASPDGRIVVSSGPDGFVRGWDVETGSLMAEVDLSSAGRPFVDDTTMRSEEDEERRTGRTYPFEKLGHTIEEIRSIFRVYSLAFSPDGRWIACGMGTHREVVDPLLVIDTRARPWKVRRVTEYPVRERPAWWGKPGEMDFTFTTIFQLSFSNDGHWLLTCSGEGARLYNTRVTSFDGSGEWTVGPVIGYDWYADREVKGAGFRTVGAQFIGKTDIIVILHEGGIIEALDRKRPDKPIWVAFAGTGEEDSYDGSLTTSLDGRWIAVGRHGGPGLVLIDLGLYDI
nr:hypothetical protein [Candidatus Sigynarchaeum springense]